MYDRKSNPLGKQYKYPESTISKLFFIKTGRNVLNPNAFLSGKDNNFNAVTRSDPEKSVVKKSLPPGFKRCEHSAKKFSAELRYCKTLIDKMISNCLSLKGSFSIDPREEANPFELTRLIISKEKSKPMQSIPELFANSKYEPTPHPQSRRRLPCGKFKPLRKVSTNLYCFKKLISVKSAEYAGSSEVTTLLLKKFCQSFTELIL